MEYGLIKDTTMKGIADGLREKGIVPATRLEDYYADCESFASKNVTSMTDPTPTTTCKQDIIVNIPEAHSLEFVFTVEYVTKLEAEVALGTIEVIKDSFKPFSKTIYNTTTEKTFSTKLDPAYGGGPLTVKINSGVAYGAENCFGVIFDVYALDAEGNRMKLLRQRSIPNYISPAGIIEAINGCLPIPPESAFKITGNCQNKFSYDGWNWFLNNYGDKITTDNITIAEHMFLSNPIERIPIDINLSDSCTNTEHMFSECANLVELPVVNNFADSASICDGCRKLTSINGNKFRTPADTVSANSLFVNCFKLRTVDGFFDNIPDEIKGTSIFGLHNTFNNCYSLDEVLNLPYVYSTYNSSYFFIGMVSGCFRLKRLTFRNQVVTKSTKSATLDLTATGWATSPYNDAVTIMHNKTDFTDETRVTDDATYQALKNNPDWWTVDVAYSRYNHDSAVETINSLPDVTATGITNTIKFKGGAGSNTDGGAINTLTAEEIAVATAKGWTVSLV